MASQRANDEVKKHMEEMYDAIQNENEEKMAYHYHEIMRLYGIE